jgi:hypothetical protein
MATGGSETIDQCWDFGLLYNFYAKAGTGTTSITSSDDWIPVTYAIASAMVTYYGGTSDAHDEIEYPGADLVYWDRDNGATNISGLSYRGSGIRQPEGTFSGKTNVYRGWLDQYNSTNGRIIGMSADTIPVIIISSISRLDKKFGCSVRLVSDATGIPDGTKTTYTGNDGSVYSAIAVNGYYWIQSDLIETKLRDGSIIPFHGADNGNNFTNAEWAALTTAGVCAYDNDLNNVGCDFAFPTE